MYRCGASCRCDGPKEGRYEARMDVRHEGERVRSSYVVPESKKKKIIANLAVRNKNKKTKQNKKVIKTITFKRKKL